MKRILIIVVVFSLSTRISYGQENDYDYNREVLWGINKNSSSGLIGGVMLRFSKLIKPNHYRTLGLELINVKHPAESKVASQKTGNYFVVGKTNHLFAIRGQYGRDIVLFKKAPQQGVQITASGSVGPSFGLESPYYIELKQFARVPYDPTKHLFEEITGSGFIFQGLLKSNIVVGVNLRAGLSFEFGTFKSNVSGFEIGMMLDAYARKINMIPKADNNAVWPSVYISLFYGTRK